MQNGLANFALSYWSWAIKYQVKEIIIMRRIFMLSVFLIVCIIVLGQTDSILIGGYRNIVEFKRKTPTYRSSFTFKKKEHPMIPELFYAKSNDRKIKGSILKKSIFIIYTGEKYYINAERIGMVPGYIKIDTLRHYSYFKGKPIKTAFQQEKNKNAFFYYGVAGYAISSAETYSEISGNIYYVFNSETGSVNLLNRQYLSLILQPYSELDLKYQIETNKDSLDVMLDYLDLLNKRIESE